MIRVVFDAVIFVRALLNRHSLWAALLFDRHDAYRVVFSRPIVEEIVGVLARPELTRRFSALPGRDVATVRRILADAELVQLTEGDIPAISRDRKDDKYPATAEVAGAAFVVTEDQDLLVLGVYGGVRIIDAATFLAILENLAISG